jgi:hypothetical protein
MSGRRAFVNWVLFPEDSLQVYEAWCVCRRVEVASPGGLGPSFRIAIARIAAAGGAFTFEDEVDPAKFVRGVMARGTRLVISSGHDAPRLSLLLGGRSGECSAVVPIDLRRSWAKLRCERGRRVAALALLMRDGSSGYSPAAAWPREARVRFGTIGGSSSPRCAFSSASRSSRLSSGSGSSAPGASPASSPVSSDPSSLSR